MQELSAGVCDWRGLRVLGSRERCVRRSDRSSVLWREGVPLATIQNGLGHTNISQTSRHLATTGPGNTVAMQWFEARLGPIDTD